MMLQSLQAFDRLAHQYGSVPPHEFDMWQQATGWAFSSEGLLASRELRVQVGTSDKFHAAGCMAFAEEQCPSVCIGYRKHCRQLVAKAGQQWENTLVSGCSQMHTKAAIIYLLKKGWKLTGNLGGSKHLPVRY